MLISEVISAGAAPTLEAAMRFSAQRQRLIVHNIANVSTPNFRPVDVEPRVFQGRLREAVEARRASESSHGGPLRLKAGEGVRVGRNGELALEPSESGDGVLMHDRNNRSVERLMQDLAENTAAFRMASDLLRQHYSLLNAAMSERV